MILICVPADTTVEAANRMSRELADAFEEKVLIIAALHAIHIPDPSPRSSDD